MRGLQLKRQIKKFYMIPVLLFCSIVWLFWQYSQMEERETLLPAPQQLEIIANEPIQPLPLSLELNRDKIELGQKLFNERRLSQDNTISCANCHNLNSGGTDRSVRSLGINGKEGFVNSPTVFNSGFNFKQFWDGRAETLEEQIEGPINSDIEMGSNWEEIVGKLKKSPDYVSGFNQIYPDGISTENIKDAIATFERSLYTPNSPFDRFLRGDRNAITPEEREGYLLFKTYGCASCHQGMMLGGNMFQTFGVLGDYFGDRGNITEADLGRYNVTGATQDRYVFKVPSLRNVVLTRPYFHDGSANTLKEAVLVMVKYQLGRKLPEEDTDLIIAFLKTLTGEYKGKPL